MEKIGWGQLALVLSATRIFSEATALPDTDIIYGMQRYTVIFASFILTALSYIPLYLISRKYSGEGIFDIAVRKNRIFAAVIGIIFIAFILVSMIETGLRAYYYTSSTIFEAASSPVLGIIICVAVLYALYKGLSAVVRTGAIVAALFGVLLILVFGALFSEIKPENFYLAILDRPRTFISEVLTEYSKNTEILIFAVLCGEVREKSHRSIIASLLISYPVLLLMTFMYNTILGEYMDSVNFPFYTLASVSDISVFQRLNGIDTAVWTAAAIIKLALFAIAVRVIVSKCFAGKKAALICGFTAVILTSGLSVFFAGALSVFGMVLSVTETALPLVFVCVIIPIAVLMAAAAGKKRRPYLEEI